MYRKKILLILLTIALISFIQLTSCRLANKKSYSINCNTCECLEKNKNKDAVIEGIFQKYTPYETGKGAGYMFWDWEILLSDSLTVPVNSTFKGINYKKFEDKKVFIIGTIFYGIIIGCEEGQNATGFRIDPKIIEVLEK